ncbi:lactonase family protein [Paenibacillus glycanilyticus]|uniref:lactonase family protein n=1 Tax=Paenibacillus glycanilyticus TaxID=126569 RepID=UPI00204260A3|nr:lactonase family protein [Paenibacillus glycanilyticus]MCM3630501.1 lactonase family protein [Paenibacillus glycanilyticus]
MSKNQTFAGTLYIGSYGAESEATIRVCDFDGAAGTITVKQEVTKVENASYLAVDPSGRHLYAVSETGRTGTEAGGSVVSFAVEEGSGHLTELNRQLSHGADPCYITVDALNKTALVANYTGGNASLLPINEDGTIAPATSVVREEAPLGSNTARQEAPHAHAIVVNGNYVYVNDLGTDLIHTFKIEEGTKLVKQSSCKLHSGAGPRHIVFHKSQSNAYVMNELDSTITLLRVSESGELTPVQTVSALPEGFSGYNDAADIHLSPSGQYLYSSNRGHNSIAVFAVDQADGGLTLIQNASCEGDAPRNFLVLPDGSQLLVANQKTGNIVLFSVNQETGLIHSEGTILEVPSPVCIRLGAAKRLG